MSYVEKPQDFIPDSELEEHPILRGFFRCPLSPELYVSRAGVVWTEDRETFVRPSPNKYSYPGFSSRDKSYLLHVVLASTFIRKFPSDRPLVVNHRDGRKSNFALTNLEWVTESQNIFHAFKTGLISNKSVKVKVKNLVSGEVREVDSINACARLLACNPSKVYNYLRHEPSAPFLGEFDVVYADSKWNAFTKDDVGKPAFGRNRPVIVTNTQTNVTVIYGSATRAAQCIPFKQPEICARASGRQPRESKGYRFVWLDEYLGSREGIPYVPAKEPVPVISQDFVRRERPVRLHYDDGTVEDFEGSTAAGKKHGVCKDTIQRLARMGAKLENFRVEYLRWPPSR